MDNFKYAALNKDNELVEGEIEAEDAKDARRKIRELGMLPTKVYSEKDLEKYSDYKAKGSVKFLWLSEKLLFTSELHTFLSSGIPILNALNSMENMSLSGSLRTVASEIQEEIKSGRTFAEALNYLYGRVFGYTYVSLIDTGEKSGELEKILDRLCLIYRKQENLKSKIINASIYPSLLILGFLILAVLFAKLLFPKLLEFLSASGGIMPPFAQTVFDVLAFISDFWWVVGLLTISAIGLIIIILQDKKIKKMLDGIVLKLPAISRLVEYAYLSNYLTVLQTAYDAGVPIMKSLELAAETVGNLVMKDRAIESMELFKDGKTLSESFQESKLTAGDTVEIISAGEKSGKLGKTLQDASNIMERKVDFALNAVMKLAEPIALSVIGIFIAIVAVAFVKAYIASLMKTVF